MRCRYLLILAVQMGCSGGEKPLFEENPTNLDIPYRGTYVARQDSIFLNWPIVEVVKSGAWEGNEYMTFLADVDIAGIKGLGTFRR